MGLFGDQGAGDRSKRSGGAATREQGGRYAGAGVRGQDAHRAGGRGQMPDLVAVSEAPTPYSADHDLSIPDTQYPISNPLADLNPEQRAAVLCTDAPLVIVAGPGTGKTRTLTVRIAYQIQEKGVAPENILAVTFTNKAAGEMAERLAGLLGAEVARRVTIKTFHAFGAMLLREHAERLGLSPEFVILGEEERATLLRQACPQLKQREIEAYLTEISEAKNRLLGPDDLRLKSEADTPSPLKRTDADAAQPTSAGLAYQSAVSTADPTSLYARYDAALPRQRRRGFR